MRCFTYHGGQLTRGIKTTLSRTGKRLIFFGAKGFGCNRQLVFFDKKKENHPNVDSNGMISFAYLTKRKFFDKYKGIIDKKIILKKAYPSQTKALLRINTSTPSSYRINGRWQEIGGWPTLWVNANGYYQGQIWVDDLVVIDDQDIILVIPAGGGRLDRKIIYNLKGEIGCIPEVGYKDVIKRIKEEQSSLIITSQLPEEEIDKVIIAEQAEFMTEKIKPRVQRSNGESTEDKIVQTINSEENGKALDEPDTVIHDDLIVLVPSKT